MKIILPLLIILLSACTVPEEPINGLRHDNEQLMTKFREELDKRQIPYELSDEGFIFYDSKHKADINAVEEYLLNRISMSYHYSKVEEREYFKELLKANNIDHYEEQRDDGIWVVWYPQYKNQHLEFSQAVAEYVFESRSSGLN